MNVNSEVIRDLVANGRIEEAIAAFRDISRVQGGALRARLFLLERERSQGAISHVEYDTFLHQLADTLLKTLDEYDKETSS